MKNKKKKKRRVFWLVLEIILLVVIAAALFLFVQFRKMGGVRLGNIQVNTGVTGPAGYRNIALFGVDSREGELDAGTNSDTILICSINNKTKDVTLVSLYRDTYVNDSTGHYCKAGEVYAAGGAQRSLDMLNMNLDLDVSEYMTIDFNAIVHLVDRIGGIDLEITEEEMKWLNGYCVENSQVTGVDYIPLESAGYQHLSGIQALAYCRIRYTDGWDFKRTERQRQVLSLVFKQAKSEGIGTLTGLVQDLMPYVSTSLSLPDLISLVSTLGSFSLSDSTGFPFETAFADLAAGDVVVPVDLAANVSRLHALLFGQEDYAPSQTVREISDTIRAETGI